MNLFPPPKRNRHRGLTLMEAVIALGVIAVAVPLILATTTSGARTRVQAEADTRSAWLAQDLQRQLTDSWKNIPSPAFVTKPKFPQFSSPESPTVLLFDNEGAFLASGTSEEYTKGSSNPKAFYLVALHGASQTAFNITGGGDSMSKVTISVENSARAAKQKRTANSFVVLIPRQTSP